MKKRPQFKIPKEYLPSKPLTVYHGIKPEQQAKLRNLRKELKDGLHQSR